MQVNKSKGRYTRLTVKANTLGNRTAPSANTITVATGGAAAGATTIPVNALSAAVYANSVLIFASGKRAVVSADAAASATSLTVEALAASLLAADTATDYGLKRVMGVTTSTYGTAPRTQELGSNTYESSEEKQWQDVDVIGDSWNISVSAEPDLDDAGFKVIETASINGSEVWVKRETMRKDGTVARIEEGAALITGFSRPNPAENVITAAWTFQGQGKPVITTVAAS
jgi:hypothetical protein